MSGREEVARAALVEMTPLATIGPLTDTVDEGEGVHTLSFAADVLGYPGWHWSVSVAELPGEDPTVLEAELLPGEGSLVAPDWVPWAERLEEYRAAQAAAAAEEDDSDEEDSEDDDSEDDDAEDDDESDEGEDLDGDESAGVLAGDHDEQDEAEAESADDGPEQPDEA